MNGLRGKWESLAHSTYKKRTAVEGGSDSRESLAQRSKAERRRVPGQLQCGSYQMALTNLSRPSLKSNGIHPQTRAMRWDT